jgi:hypothetical protein
VERRGHLHDVNPMRERRARVTIQENCPRGTRELAVQFGRGAAETGTYTRDAVRAVTMNKKKKKVCETEMADRRRALAKVSGPVSGGKKRCIALT